MTRTEPGSIPSSPRFAHTPPRTMRRVSVLSLCSLVAVACFVFSGCQQARIRELVPYDNDIIKKERDGGYYLSRLTDLPLRFEPRFHVDMRNKDVKTHPAMRELHLLRAEENGSQDLIVAVFDDRSVQGWSAHTFTYQWESLVENRTVFDPLMTRDSVFFINRDGSYQLIDRHSGDFLKTGVFGPGYYPTTTPISNGTHVFIPASSPLSFQGWPDSRLGGAESGGVRTWSYPQSAELDSVRFSMVTLPPTVGVGLVYFVGSNNYLYALSAENGTLKYRIDLGRDGVPRTPPIVAGTQLYAGSDAEFFAIDTSGEVLWTWPTEGPVVGQMYAMDDWVFFHTSLWTPRKPEDPRERSRSEEPTSRRRGEKAPSPARSREAASDTRLPSRAPRARASAPEKVELYPGDFIAMRFSRSATLTFDPDGQPGAGGKGPIKVDEQGRPEYDLDVVHPPRGPEWSLPSQRQRVLLKTERYLFVLYDEWDIPYTSIQQVELRKAGRVIKDDEMKRSTKRVLQVLDLETGLVARQGGEAMSFDVSEFPFILGSMDPNDRALYFATREGHLFKGFAIR